MVNGNRSEGRVRAGVLENR